MRKEKIMFKSDYTYRLLEKENKRLTYENQRLRNQIDETNKLKKEYLKLVTDLKGYKEKYAKVLDDISDIESEMGKEIKRLME